MLAAIQDGAERLHALSTMIPRLLDSHRRRSMMNLAMQSEQEWGDTVESLGKMWFFSPENPTGHYLLDLGEHQEREVFKQICSIANSETEYAKNRSQHTDTSMKQDWSPIRHGT